MSAHVISMINLKGGVAKTTTTIGLAQCLSANHEKKVLVIDLDPQTNATVMLIGEDKWQSQNKNGWTLEALFRDAIEKTNKFDLGSAVLQGVSGIRDVKSVDLLPSSIDLISTQDKLINTPRDDFHSGGPTEILKNAIKPIIDHYDYVLIDCPPHLGIITLNGLRISKGYIIPTIPDILSTYGIPQIVNRVTDYAKAIGEKIIPLGIVVTKMRPQSSLHKRTLENLKEEKDAPLFKTIFLENNQMAEAAEYIEHNTLRQKWGYQGQYEKFSDFTEEVHSILE